MSAVRIFGPQGQGAPAIGMLFGMDDEVRVLFRDGVEPLMSEVGPLLGSVGYIIIRQIGEGPQARLKEARICEWIMPPPRPEPFHATDKFVDVAGEGPLTVTMRVLGERCPNCEAMILPSSIGKHRCPKEA